MFCPDQNAYLQLVCPIEPRVINKAVRKAMRRKVNEPRDDKYNLLTTSISSSRLDSSQPSLSMPFVDVTEARLGLGRNGLKIVVRELNSPDKLTKIRAVHTVGNLVAGMDCALHLIDLHVIYRLIDLMQDIEPIIRERVAFILTKFATMYQGRKRIMSRPIVVDHLIQMFMQDRKEVRYAAALCLKTLTRDRCACEIINKNDKIIVSLLKMIKHDYMEIVLYHLNSLKNLSEWDPVGPLKANAFLVMKKLLVYHQYRVVHAALDCMTQMCKHSVGKQLADKYDLNCTLLHYLMSPEIEVIVSAVGLMQYTTVTTQSKWRAKQFGYDLIKRLVALTASHTVPILQLRSLQVMINLSSCSDIRFELKNNWEQAIASQVKIRPFENWDGTSTNTTFTTKTGYNYETMCIEDEDTIKADFGDRVQAFDTQSYAKRIADAKKRLLAAINNTNYKE
ncbi:uncharacterized protein LOC124642686 [Helicoverpa zea]|uniref:uncharacterized protein LOC124642686 n=1 Tax=Helicoverpa zea TaxID=7113 RepID=UPI001F574A38|nr:uncharacterized protein LOC124642686 [Helicoverpa zea]